MCGRYSIYDIEEIQSRFNVEFDVTKGAGPNQFGNGFKATYNAAPSQILPIITNEKPNQVTFARWGFVPHWAKDDKFKTINARAESVSEKPTFKKAFEENRCLIPADGFYEWKKVGGKKIPYRFILTSEGKSGGSKLFAFAGIWSMHNEIVTFSIITTQPNKLMSPIHDRMPVILTQHNEKIWLEKPEQSILKPYESDKMECIQVSDKINSTRNDGPDLIKKVATLDGF
jgi:putative SOS response-associated peptidase YedK